MAEGERPTPRLPSDPTHSPELTFMNVHTQRERETGGGQNEQEFEGGARPLQIHLTISLGYSCPEKKSVIPARSRKTAGE